MKRWIHLCIYIYIYCLFSVLQREWKANRKETEQKPNWNLKKRERKRNREEKERKREEKGKKIRRIICNK